MKDREGNYICKSCKKIFWEISPKFDFSNASFQWDHDSKGYYYRCKCGIKNYAIFKPSVEGEPLYVDRFL